MPWTRSNFTPPPRRVASGKQQQRRRDSCVIVLYFDGTRNQPEDNTNPWRTDLRIVARDRNANEQLVYYDEGVGSHWHDWLTGGAFGRGLSENIQQDYQWLLRNYEAGHEIFVFGFSRGAYTARSLVGFLGKCGLLRPDSPKSVVNAYELYRNRSVKSASTAARSFRADHSRVVRMQFLGVCCRQADPRAVGEVD